MLRCPPPRRQPCKTIAISKIPAKENSVHALLRFFKKYGHIESVWCQGTRAVVSFASESSAMSAYLDPDPYLSNRFVRIVFHSSPASNESNLEQFIDAQAVEARAAAVRAKLDAKVRDQELMLRAMRSGTADSLEALKKRRSEYVLAASRLVSTNAASADEAQGWRDQLKVFRELIDETQSLIDQFNRPSPAGTG
jgi:hypothetical protein